MFYIIIILAIIILFYAIYYVLSKMKNISFIKQINNKYLRLLCLVLPLVILYIIIGLVNFVIVLLHLMFFIFISEIVMKIVNKSIKKNYSYNYAYLIGLMITVIYLGIGIYLNYHVFETHYVIYTNKDLGSENFRIIQISDAHMGTTFDGEEFYRKIQKLSNIECDIVVITGDFVDDDTKRSDMEKSIEAFEELKPKYGIYYVNGNHDKGYYQSRDFSYDDLVSKFKEHNVHVLEDDIANINDYIYLIGRKDRSDPSRKSIDELTMNLDKKKYVIDLNHQPNDYQNEMNKVDLVLSGHTHGGQLIPLGLIGILMHANDEVYGLHTRGSTNFIVNSGISDWAIMFKTGTYSEIGIIDITNS